MVAIGEYVNETINLYRFLFPLHRGFVEVG